MADKRARLLMSAPIEARLQAMRERADDHEYWGGKSTAITMRLCVAEIEDAIEEAAEIGAPTIRASELSGWAVGTLQKYARQKIDGRRLPHVWRGLQCELDGAGDYVFVLSTIPVHAAQREERSA